MPTCRRSIHLHAKPDRINASLQACMITALIYASMSHRLLCACVACAHMEPHDDLPQSTGNSPMPARSVHLLQTRRPPANVHSLQSSSRRMLASARRCRLPSQTQMWTRTDKTHGGTCIIAIAKKASARGSCSRVCRRASGGVAWINMYTVYVMEVPLLAQSAEALVITACSFAAHGFAAHGAASVWCLGQMQYLQLHITMSMQVLQVLVSTLISCQDPVQSIR